MQIIKAFLEARRKVETLEADLKAAKEEAARLQEAALEFMIEEEAQKLTVEGQTLYIHKQLWANMVDTSEAALNALRGAGLAALIKPTVNSQSLSSYVREQEEIGVDLPAGLLPYIKIAEKFEVRVRKA